MTSIWNRTSSAKLVLVMFCLLLSPLTVFAEGDSSKTAGNDAGAETDSKSNAQAAPSDGSKPDSAQQPSGEEGDAPVKPTEAPVTAPEKPLAKSTAKSEKPDPAGSADALKLYGSGKYAQAAAMYQKYISQGTDNSDTHMYLGACYQQLKKYDDALKQYDWVAKNSVLISSKKKGESAAHTLRCYRAGICPGNCLKLSSPGWAHYPGLDPKLLYMKFTYSGGWVSWSTHHLGEVIVYENGKPVSKGKCTICRGTGKVPKLK